MADPFSIVASTASIADICIRLVRYLKDVQKGAATIEDDIKGLIREVEALHAVSYAIEKTSKEHPSSPPAYSKDEHQEDLWKHVKRTLENCQTVTERLENIAKEIYGKSGPSVNSLRDAVVKSHRRRSKEAELRQCRDQLTTYQNGLQLLLASINL